MAYFDRFDICEAYLAIEWDYSSGGWLHERPSNRRRRESTDVQLTRIGFRPGASFSGYDSLSDNGKEIYSTLQDRYGFRAESGYSDCACRDCFDVAITDHGEAALCSLCQEAGCELNHGECQRPDAYGAEDGESGED